WANRNANHPRVNAWVWTSTNAGVTSYDGLGPQATGASDQRFIAEMPELQRMNEVERSDYLARRAREYALAHPGVTLKLAVVKIARMWSPMPLSDDHRGRWYAWGAGFYTLVVYGLLVTALVRNRLPRSVQLYLLLPALYFTVVHAASVGSLRYRIPAEPPMLIVAASMFARRARTERSSEQAV